ncbi:hypothetical protein HVX39_08730 [Escherichia coli]|nr:hypothetical protein HVX39_08730 [Escherichia coli]
MSDSYFDRLPKFKPSQEAMDKRAFDEEMNKVAEDIVATIPDLLEDLLDVRADMLFEQLPECMKQPNPVTREVLNEKHIRRMLAGKVGNKLGRGMNFLQK